MRVLIVEDGQGAYLLAAVRSFGAQGWFVGIASPGPSRAAGSRFVGARHRVPPPELGLEQFAGAVRDAIRRGRYDIVFGGDDSEVLALSACRDQLDALVPYAAHDRVLAAIDKLDLHASALAVGMAVPVTVAADHVTIASFSYPAVIKPRLHWDPATGIEDREPVPVVAGPVEAAERAAEVTLRGGSPLLQEMISGDLVATTALVDHDGQVVARSQQRALITTVRGTSARAVTVAPDPVLADQVDRLVARLGWFGLANLQFLAPPDGPPRLIDFNGRFYGSLALTIAAGVDVPAMWVRMATGETVDSPVAQPGVAYQSLAEDLERCLVLDGGRLKALVGTGRFALGATHSSWAAKDPGPAARLGSELSLRSVRRLARSAVTRLGSRPNRRT